MGPRQRNICPSKCDPCVSQRIRSPPPKPLIKLQTHLATLKYKRRLLIFTKKLIFSTVSNYNFKPLIIPTDAKTRNLWYDNPYLKYKLQNFTMNTNRVSPSSSSLASQDASPTVAAQHPECHLGAWTCPLPGDVAPHRSRGWWQHATSDARDSGISTDGPASWPPLAAAGESTPRVLFPSPSPHCLCALL